MWEDELQRSNKGIIKTSNHNLRLFIENKIAPRKDIFSNQLFASDGKLLRDKDGIILAADISKEYGVEFNSGRIIEAILGHAEEFHPVRDYLNRLKWDGVKRAETIFIDYLRAQDIPGYTRLATRHFLLGCVNRIFDPGSNFQEIVVTIGEQGIYKSGIFHDLGKGWFTDSLRSAETKIVGEETAGAWIVELAELNLLNGMREEAKKEFISRRIEKYRPAYARLTAEYPRQFVLVGTSNKMEFLGDYTGDRRYMPIACGLKSEIQNIKPWDIFPLVVDHVWAEVMTWYSSGERPKLPVEAWEVFEAERENFRYENSVMDEVKEVIEKLGYPEKLSAEYIAKKIGWLESNRAGNAKINDAIRRLGGYERIMKPAKVEGKATRNAWERSEKVTPIVTITQNKLQHRTVTV